MPDGDALEGADGERDDKPRLPVREDLAAEMYDQLRHLAHRFLSRQHPGQTLQATDLVHETYIRLGAGASESWADRAHFYRSAALAMRHILIDRARRRKALRHGGDRIRLDLRDDLAPSDTPIDDFLMLDEALQRLHAVDERTHQIVMLRYFAGLTLHETADIVGVSLATAKRDWAFAKAWLYAEIGRR